MARQFLLAVALVAMVGVHAASATFGMGGYGMGFDGMYHTIYDNSI